MGRHGESAQRSDLDAARQSADGTGTNAERNAAIFAQRYGAMGPDVSTLQACGDRHGMTRERARQICERMLERATAFVVRLDRSASTRQKSRASPASKPP